MTSSQTTPPNAKKIDFAQVDKKTYMAYAKKNKAIWWNRFMHEKEPVPGLLFCPKNKENSNIPLGYALHDANLTAFFMRKS